MFSRRARAYTETMSDKFDFKKELDAYRARHGEFSVVDLPELQYLMLDGQGDPNDSAPFAAAIGALYSIAYTLKFASKRSLGRDYVVAPLEGLWWADDMSVFTGSGDKSSWRWTLLILTPDWIDADMFAGAVEQAKEKGKDDPELLDRVRLERLAEGRCVQTLHIGRFDDEADVLARMHEEFIPDHGFRMTGRHHEIYLSDFRRVAPEKRRTILRQPVLPI